MLVAPSSLHAQPAPACQCGPDFFVGDNPSVPDTLAQKKQRLSAGGFPAELVYRLDPDGKCVAAIQHPIEPSRKK